MYLEERMDRLEAENAALRQRVESLEMRGADRFLTVAEAAKKLNCSTSAIYAKVNSGEISVTRKAGGIRIPMAQFFEPGKKVVKLPEKKKKAPQTLKEQVFG